MPKLVAFISVFLAAAVFGTAALAVVKQFNVRLTVTDSVAAYVNFAIPEGRVGAEATNWDTDFYLTVRDTGGNTLYSQPILVQADNRGKYLTPITLTGITPGNYDVTIKGHQHLTRKMTNIALVAGNNRLNFTQPDNSTATGTVVLLTGDVSGAGTTPGTLGDDVVNSVDLSIILGVLDDDDLTGNGIRSNLNQDVVVNSVDLSLLIKNLDVEGD